MIQEGRGGEGADQHPLESLSESLLLCASYIIFSTIGLGICGPPSTPIMPIWLVGWPSSRNTASMSFWSYVYPDRSSCALGAAVRQPSGHVGVRQSASCGAGKRIYGTPAGETERPGRREWGWAGMLRAARAARTSSCEAKDMVFLREALGIATEE